MITAKDAQAAFTPTVLAGVNLSQAETFIGMSDSELNLVIDTLALDVRTKREAARLAMDTLAAALVVAEGRKEHG